MKPYSARSPRARGCAARRGRRSPAARRARTRVRDVVADACCNRSRCARCCDPRRRASSSRAITRSPSACCSPRWGRRPRNHARSSTVSPVCPRPRSRASVRPWNHRDCERVARVSAWNARSHRLAGRQRARRSSPAAPPPAIAFLTQRCADDATGQPGRRRRPLSAMPRACASASERRRCWPVRVHEPSIATAPWHQPLHHPAQPWRCDSADAGLHRPGARST